MTELLKEREEAVSVDTSKYSDDPKIWNDLVAAIFGQTMDDWKHYHEKIKNDFHGIENFNYMQDQIERVINARKDLFTNNPHILNVKRNIDDLYDYKNNLEEYVEEIIASIQYNRFLLCRLSKPANNQETKRLSEKIKKLKSSNKAKMKELDAVKKEIAPDLDSEKLSKLNAKVEKMTEDIENNLSEIKDAEHDVTLLAKYLISANKIDRKFREKLKTLSPEGKVSLTEKRKRKIESVENSISLLRTTKKHTLQQEKDVDRQIKTLSRIVKDAYKAAESDPIVKELNKELNPYRDLDGDITEIRTFLKKNGADYASICGLDQRAVINRFEKVREEILGM